MPEGIRQVNEAGVAEGQEGVQPRSQIRPVGPPEGTQIAAAGAEFRPDHCQGLTAADGAACKARPLKGELLCVGHTRSATLNA